MYIQNTDRATDHGQDEADTEVTKFLRADFIMLHLLLGRLLPYLIKEIRLPTWKYSRTHASSAWNRAAASVPT